MGSIYRISPAEDFADIDMGETFWLNYDNRLYTLVSRDPWHIYCTRISYASMWYAAARSWVTSKFSKNK